MTRKILLNKKHFFLAKIYNFKVLVVMQLSLCFLCTAVNVELSAMWMFSAPPVEKNVGEIVDCKVRGHWQTIQSSHTRVQLRSLSKLIAPRHKAIHYSLKPHLYISLVMFSKHYITTACYNFILQPYYPLHNIMHMYRPLHTI